MIKKNMSFKKDILKEFLDMSIQQKQKVFIYGTQYYRIPNPPREQHSYHLKKIKDELGFNTVKLFTLLPFWGEQC